MTVTELVAALGVTTTAVSLQLTRLVASGYLVRAQRRGRQGRPASVYALSDRAKETLAGAPGEFSRSLIEELFRVEGAAEAKRVLRAVARRMGRAAREVIGNGSAAQRLARFAELAGSGATTVESSKGGERVSLNVYACPYPGLAEKHREICEMEELTLSEVLGTPVKLQHCMIDGHRCCEFATTER
jgi:predicted ArsR family transcriptional regulator